MPDKIKANVTERVKDIRRLAEETGLSNDRIVNLCVEKALDQLDEELKVLKKKKAK